MKKKIEKLTNYKTFNEWKSLKRYVVKGQKSKKKDKDGVALFHINQTTEGAYFMCDGKGNDYHDEYDSMGLTAHDMGADF